MGSSVRVYFESDDAEESGEAAGDKIEWIATESDCSVIAFDFVIGDTFGSRRCSDKGVAIHDWSRLKSEPSRILLERASHFLLPTNVCRSCVDCERTSYAEARTRCPLSTLDPRSRRPFDIFGFPPVFAPPRESSCLPRRLPR